MQLCNARTRSGDACRRFGNVKNGRCHLTQGRLVGDSVVKLKIENGQIYEVDSGLEALQHKAPVQAAVIDIIKEHPCISRQKQLVEMSGLPQSQVSQIEKSLKRQGRITGGRGEPYQYLGDAI